MNKTKSIQTLLLLLFIFSSTSCDSVSKKEKITSPWGVASHPRAEREWQRIDTLMTRAQEAGIKWMREDFAFGAIYHSTGDFHFERYDSLLDIAEKYGIQILPILQGFDHEVARNNPLLVPLYDHPEEWRKFVRETVERYHTRVKHWEIWNEQDGGFWKPIPNAAQYVGLLKIAYEEIKKIDPGSQVITGGTIGWNPGYLEAIYNEGARGYFDIVAVHAYGFGHDVNIKAKRMQSEVLDVIKKHETKEVPIWITECGGSGFQGELFTQQEDFVIQAINYSLAKIGNIPASGLTIGLAVPVRTASPEELTLTRSWLPGVTLKPVVWEDIAHTDPSDCQVIIGAEGLNIDRPLIKPLKEYVEKGGLLFGANKVPFHTVHYQDENGAWLQKDTPEEFYKQFRLSFHAHWSKQGIPTHTHHIETSKDAQKEGLPNISNIYVDRFLDGSGLQEEDSYYPIIRAFHNGIYVGEGMSLYTYKDWKGGVLLSTVSVDTGFSEDEQANILQRSYLTYLAQGVEKLFWYDMHNDGQLKGEREHNFGLLNYDFTPKKSFYAYKELTQHLGSNPKFIRKTEGEKSDIWVLIFRKEETGEEVLTAWSTDDIDYIEIKVNDKIVKKEVSNKKVLFYSLTGTESIKF